MPMVDASTQMSPPQTPISVTRPAPPRRNASAGPSNAPAPAAARAIDEKEPLRPVSPQAAATPPAPQAPRVRIIQMPRTPCVAQPVALLAFVVGVGLGVVMGLAFAGILPPITGYAAAVLGVMLLLFMAGAPPFHDTYPGAARTRS